ncbi:unnamed protein product, partial [Brassica oleracea var. botrytis]
MRSSSRLGMDLSGGNSTLLGISLGFLKLLVWPLTLSYLPKLKRREWLVISSFL